MTLRRAALAAIVIATLAIATAYASAFAPGGAPRWAPWLLSSGTSVAMIALATLGAVGRDGKLGWLALPLGFTLVILIGGFALALTLPATGAAEPLFLGLPRRAAVVLYGIGVLPALVLPIAYALSFDARTLTEADLERVRVLGRAAKAKAAESTT
ncbi:MAG: hypothetical protein M3081_01950 [Gemmatimonadota bacterium]|nr:hypothetical protein [Gemmatimonadota bacterium]